MKQFSSTLALFFIGLLFVSVILNVVYIPKAFRKPTVDLQPYEKQVIVNAFPDQPKLIVNQVIREGLKPISEDSDGVRVYSDTIKNQEVEISFTNRVRGELLSSKLDYTFTVPRLQPSPIQPTINNQPGRLYATGTLYAGAGNNFALGVIYVPGRSRLLLGYQYAIGTGTHSMTLGYKF